MKKLAQLMALAMQQNSPNQLTWMISYSGHVNLLDISFYPKGYENSDYEDCENFEAYLFDSFRGKPDNKAINDACKFLEKNLKTLIDSHESA